MKKFLIGSIVSLGLLFGTMPRAEAAVHVSLPVHPSIYIKLVPTGDGECEAYGLQYLGFGMFYWEDLGSMAC